MLLTVWEWIRLSLALVVFFGIATPCLFSRLLLAEETFYLGAIQVNEPRHEAWVSALANSGFNTVSVTVYAKQGNWDSDNLWFAEQEPAVISEIRAARARGLNVVLILRLALDHAFARNEFYWHGMIMPKSERSLRSWFKKYQAFLLKWAKIAETEGVAVLGIGSELRTMTASLSVQGLPALESWYLDSAGHQRQNEILLKSVRSKKDEKRLLAGLSGAASYPSLKNYLARRASAWQTWAQQVTGQKDSSNSFSQAALDKYNRRREQVKLFWKELVAAARKVYSGQLTYAANFDEYSSVGFWGDLDLVGVNAYFKLKDTLGGASGKEGLESNLKLGWVKAFGAMQEFFDSQGLQQKKVLFTELGYTFKKNATRLPWSSSGLEVLDEREVFDVNKEPVSFSEREVAIRALAEVASAAPPKLCGVLYWKASTIRSHRDIEPFVLILNDDIDRGFEKALVNLGNSL